MKFKLRNSTKVSLGLLSLVMLIAVGECAETVAHRGSGRRPSTTTEPSQEPQAESTPVVKSHPVADIDSIYVVGSPVVVSTWDDDSGIWLHILSTEMTNGSANSIAIGNDGNISTTPKLSCPGGASALTPVSPDSLGEYSRQLHAVFDAAGLAAEDAMAYIDNGGVTIGAHQQAQETTWLYLGSRNLDGDDFMECGGLREVAIGANEAQVSPSDHRIAFIVNGEVISPD